MKYTNLSEDDMDIVQGFSFGGIANPMQRTMLRGSDKRYLEERQKELDAFEAQRQSYNTALQDWQTNVYQPYMAQVTNYNTQAQKYNDEVYTPYKTQFEAYEKAVADWNSGPRTEDYAGPSEPTLARTFDLTAPTTPENFSMVAPVVPFKEEDITAYQQNAADRARKDAGARAVAIDVVSNPDQFNFGSMSVAGRFMAEGGPVEKTPVASFVKGGEIDLAALAKQNAETLSDEAPEEAINTDPVGTAQQMLADLGDLGRSSPTSTSVKRKRVAAGGGGASADKAMKQEYEPLGKGDLGAMKDYSPKKKSTNSARAQLESMVRDYQIKARTAQDRAKGFSANTFGAPTLEGPTLTRGPLIAKRFEKGGMVRALKGTKAVDEKGSPVMTYRGEYGPSDKLSTELGSYSFGTKDAANLYATEPNNFSNAAEAMKVFPAQLSIRKPVVNAPGDSYIDLPVLRKALGKKEFDRVVRKNMDRIEDTNAFEELADAKGYTSVMDLMKKNPKDLDNLATLLYPILDDPKSVKVLQRRGYDGAIYGGSGATGGEPEYRVFSASQAISPYGNKPMAPRSARQQLSDIARSMDVSPTDALEFFGRSAGVAGAALTPSTLNEGEDAELARRRSMPPTVNRAEGSPEEGEIGPAFVTPKSGKGRKEGAISKQLKSGEAYANMARGVTELPYDIAGAPVDLMTMLMRPFGYDTEKPVMGSDFIKEKMSKLGVRPEPPSDPTSKGFYTAGEMLSNLTNPAGVTRSAVKGAKKVGQAAADVGKDFQQYNRQLDVPGASYAVRPTGSTMLTGPVGLNKNVSEVDQLLQGGIAEAKYVTDRNDEKRSLIENFWNTKARNYFERQYGTPDDPILEGIKTKKLKGTALQDLRSGFPEHLIDSLSVGKTRVREGERPTADFVGPGAAQSRFFPEYPQAYEDVTRRYDEATGLRGNLITTNPAAAETAYSTISSEGRAMGRAAGEAEADKMIGQGLRPELINTEIGITTRGIKDPDRIVSENSARSAKDLYAAFEEASAYKKMTPQQQLDYANEQYGKGRNEFGGFDQSEVGPNLLSQNVFTAIEKGEPVYDIGYMGKTLGALFKPENINQYLASLPARELANIRFEDAVRGGLKLGENKFRLETMVNRIKSGKPVADSVFSNGVSQPLLQFGKGSGLDGFAWKRIEKRDATVPEGAYVGHSVGGYELGGVGYDRSKMDGFNTGLWQVYTLRDNRNRPVNTVEVKMLDEFTPVVTQIKGNGRATGNTAAEKYDGAILRFLQEYLKPAAIEESNSYLTPLLQNYKMELGASPRVR